MCNYRKNKELLDTLNGPVIPHAKLTRHKTGTYTINEDDYLTTQEDIQKDYIFWIRK